MGIASIPTIYKNVRFRSRLEARWAAFFDLVGWKWEYEPLDFDGWIPDFALYGMNNKVILVEVKPILSFNEGLAERTKEEIDRNYPHLDEDETFTPTRPVLLLGTGLKYDGYVIGDVRHDYWEEAYIGEKYDTGEMDVYFNHDHRGLLSGEHPFNPAEYQSNDLWKQACNLTQWKP